MKTKLEQLTMAQFIDLMCGDTSVLLDKHEMCNEQKITLITRDIIYEYKAISDPAGVGAFISLTEKYIKAKMSVILFSMCQNLIAIKRHDMVNEILAEYISSFRTMPTKRLENEVRSRLAKAKQVIAEHEKENDKPEFDIRNQFGEQIAALMAYYKFQIDIGTMKATIYAHLVCRYNREMKAKIASLKK
jgi:hypothetical protein